MNKQNKYYIFALLSFLILPSFLFAEELADSEINEKIEAFILEHPEVIVESINRYEKKMRSENDIRKQEFLQSNREMIFNTSDKMFEGNENGKIKLVEFFDYNCGYCQKFHQELINVMNDNSIKLVIIQMPILGNFSEELTNLALASSLQGKFKVVHNYLYSNERKSKMEDILADLFLRGVDLDILKNDLESQEVSDFLSIHRSYADEFKFTGTPATIIGNQIIPGFIDADKITKILEKEFS